MRSTQAGGFVNVRGSVFGILLVASAASAQSRGYIRTRVPNTELCLYWANRTYTFNYHSAGSQQTPGTAEFVAMDAAFDTWRALAQSCSDFKFIKGPMVGVANIGYDRNSSDNTNVLVFRERACRDVVPPDDPCLAQGTCANVYQCWDHGDATIALTTNTFSNKTGVIYDADIEFNAAPQASGERFLFTTISSPPCEPGMESPLCVATDIQNTLTHEIGHVVGFDHVELSGSTMEPSAPLGETRKRIIDPGTQAGFCHVYPAGQPTPPCDELEQLDKKIVAVNRGTPGLDRMGCSEAGAMPMVFAALSLAGLGVRRRHHAP